MGCASNDHAVGVSKTRQLLHWSNVLLRLIRIARYTRAVNTAAMLYKSYDL